jgi:iron complex outermembrane receptor protein
MNAYKYYRTSFWESRNYNELFPEIVLNDLGTQILTNPRFNFYNLSANIGANYKIGENKKIYFNYSMSSRNPNPSELFSEGLHHSAARIEIGDLRFNSEIGHNLSLSYELIGEKYNFTATSFINSINDYIYIMPTYLLPTIRGVFPVWEYRQENATLYGVDIKYDKKYNQDLSTGHQFSLIKGYLKNNNEPIINLPPANFKNYISYQFFNLNNLNISLESEYVFRQNEFPNNNFDVYIPTEETFELLDTSTPPNAYHLVNFNSSMEFILNPGNKLKLNFKVRNFFDTIYKDYLNRLRYFTHDLGRNFILTAKYSF